MFPINRASERRFRLARHADRIRAEAEDSFVPYPSSEVSFRLTEARPPGDYSVAAMNRMLLSPARTVAAALLLGSFLFAGCQGLPRPGTLVTRTGDEIVVEAPRDRTLRYRVVSTAVVHFDDGRVLHDTAGDRLTLVTCWPFRGWLHSPWRYVVRCELQR